MAAARNVLINAGIMLGSIAVFLLICELVVFRFLLPATDVPKNAFIDGIIRFEPNQKGYSRLTANAEPIPYAINAQGWNSSHQSYKKERREGVRRVAIIGDSYIQAIRVPYNQSLAAQLEQQLETEEQDAEVYRFGISGAPLSQYLLMLEQEVLDYQPDIVLILLVHNDFDESFRFKSGRYTSSFLKLEMDGDQVAGEIPPSPYKSGWTDVVRSLATFRYVYYQHKIQPQTIKNLFFGKEAKYEANVEVDRILAAWPKIEKATDYLFGRLAGVAKQHGTQLAILMDADRQQIYSEDQTGEASTASKLNRLAERLAQKHGIPFLDLEESFRAAWQSNGERFEFLRDNHWNQYGHETAAEAASVFLEELGVL